MYQWCGFKSRRGKNKNLTALKSNSNTVWFNFQTYIYIYVWKLYRSIYIKEIIKKKNKTDFSQHFVLTFSLLLQIFRYNVYKCLRLEIKPNSVRIRSLSCQIFVLSSTGFELTPLIHCSTNRLAFYVQRPRPLEL